ncbi:hypothetical protein AAC387_Pa09g0892 [Persea americana]
MQVPGPLAMVRASMFGMTPGMQAIQFPPAPPLAIPQGPTALIPVSLRNLGIQHLTRLSATSIWESISKENDSNGLQFMAAIFIIVLFYLWKARNEALFEDRRPSLHLIQATLSEAISFSLKQISKSFASPQLRALFASLLIATSH